MILTNILSRWILDFKIGKTWKFWC